MDADKKKGFALPLLERDLDAGRLEKHGIERPG
jgi:hypothetical protein